MGLGNGYISIFFITWLQKRAPRDMLGRIMSLLLFANVGLAPLAQAVAGALIKVSPVGLFAGAGVLMLLVAVRAAAADRKSVSMEI